MSVTYPEEVQLTQEVFDTITDSFHHVLYATEAWQRTFWRGCPVQKLPSDLFIYQEIIHSVKPDYIVEAGTSLGGSALFFADMMELQGHGQVISIDNQFRPDRPEHPRIRYISNDSIAALGEVEGIVREKRVIVTLDSDHHKEHVLREMEAYAPLATEYLVVEDTNVRHPIEVAGIGEGPMEAVMEFLQTHMEFEIDHSAHKFLVTFNPNGWLRRRVQ